MVKFNYDDYMEKTEDGYKCTECDFTGDKEREMYGHILGHYQRGELDVKPPEKEKEQKQEEEEKEEEETDMDAQPTDLDLKGYEKVKIDKETASKLDEIIEKRGDDSRNEAIKRTLGTYEPFLKEKPNKVLKDIARMLVTQDEIEEASEAEVVEYALMGLMESYRIAAQQAQQTQTQNRNQNQNIQRMG